MFGVAAGVMLTPWAGGVSTSDVADPTFIRRAAQRLALQLGKEPPETSRECNCVPRSFGNRVSCADDGGRGRGVRPSPLQATVGKPG